MTESSVVMIDNLDLGESGVAGQVLDLQRLAYRAEAELIGFDGIPPLHESIDDLRGAALDWLGIRDGERIVAAMAMCGAARTCDIDRLVVHPAHHRQGLGRRLVQAVLHHSSVTVWAVETNTPRWRCTNRSASGAFHVARSPPEYGAPSSSTGIVISRPASMPTWLGTRRRAPGTPTRCSIC